MKTFLIALTFYSGALIAEEASYGISGNPGAVNILVGTGSLGKLLQIPEKSGVRLAGLWMADANLLANGKISHSPWSGNNLLILDLSFRLETIGWKGGVIGTEFLQFNGQPTNNNAGVIQGFNSLPGDPPLNRSELYQLWLRQEFLDGKLSFRIGKVVPTYHFNNVSKPVPTENPAVAVPSVSGLIYTPIFVNTTLDGALGGYYNSVYGAIASIAPMKSTYVNIGFFDGNVARGIQTGLKGPHFNGYYFSIAELGYGWQADDKPGIAAIGGWYQSGKITAYSETQTGMGGLYGFASQCLWSKTSGKTNEGNLSGFIQLGWNNSRTLEMNRFLGAGLTAFALIPNRPNDSFGIGIAWSHLNPYAFKSDYEFMLQSYYQYQFIRSTYLQFIGSYIPNPGNNLGKSNVVALTTRIIALF